MTEPKVTRKFCAIMSADVKGYSLLMSDDEVFTIKTLKEYKGIMSSCIEQHNGRVWKRLRKTHKLRVVE